jgi:hypothetical protein
MSLPTAPSGTTPSEAQSLSYLAAGGDSHSHVPLFVLFSMENTVPSTRECRTESTSLLLTTQLARSSRSQKPPLRSINELQLDLGLLRLY